MTLKKMRKEEVGVQSDCVVNSAPVAGCKEISNGKTATIDNSHEWKVIHVIIMVLKTISTIPLTSLNI